jgi:hypothetical protein
MVVTLSDLIEIAKLGISLIDSRLSEPERELLKVAHDNKGLIQVLRSDQTGDFVRVGRSNFENQEDPSQRVLYLDALARLIKRGWVSHEGGINFNLTADGFKKAKKLKK